MKTLIALAVAAGASLLAISPAEAAGGCGAGYHRGPHGRCVVNFRRGPAIVGPRAVIAPGLVIGNFYAGRGYWDGRRYWQHRDRWHGHWRYR